MPFVVRRADRIITISEYSKSEIEKHYPKSKGKIEVLLLGYHKNFQKLKDVKKKNQILYVGSMNNRKNFIGAIKAFKLLNDDRYKFMIIGNFSDNFVVDEQSRLLIEKSRQDINIEFRSNVNDDELIKIYNESKLFLFPSFYEGFGLPVLEAMACGTPVVCSNETSLPEVGGDAVVYCNPYSIEDIKQKIEMVINDEKLQKDMIQKGLERAKEFSWEKCADEHMRVFESLIG
ncbi:MAG: glycosyltransferase family 4 protein [Campylobacterales bacterium]